MDSDMSLRVLARIAGAMAFFQSNLNKFEINWVVLHNNNPTCSMNIEITLLLLTTIQFPKNSKLGLLKLSAGQLYK
jgi:hypothetical protein